jgi:hypothetical protein
MSARYTFGVCRKCGVQSPVILSKVAIELPEFVLALERMGWRFDLQPLCPQCCDGKEKSPDTAA